MNRAEKIKKLLSQNLPVHFFELKDESHKHALHAEHIGLARDGKLIETHFKLTLVSSAFVDKSRVERSQLVYGILNDEFKSGLHALSQSLYTPEEWAAKKPTKQTLP